MKTKSRSQRNMQFLNDSLELNNLDQEVKFDLYLQSRKVKQITAALDKIYFSSQGKEFKWLKQNPNFINELVDQLLNDSLVVLDGINLDGESIELSMKLMNDIKQALGVVQQITQHDHDQIN